MWSTVNDGGAKDDDETADVLNSLKKLRITTLQLIRIILNTRWGWTHLGPRYHLSNAWSTYRHHSQNAQYFNPVEWAQSFKEFRQAFPHPRITIGGSKTKVIRPVKRTILQTVGDVLCDSGREIFDFRISDPGILEPADIETEFGNHRLEASNSQVYIRVAAVDSILGGTAIAVKEF